MQKSTTNTSINISKNPFKYSPINVLNVNFIVLKNSDTQFKLVYKTCPSLLKQTNKLFALINSNHNEFNVCFIESSQTDRIKIDVVCSLKMLLCTYNIKIDLLAISTFWLDLFFLLFNSGHLFRVNRCQKACCSLLLIFFLLSSLFVCSFSLFFSTEQATKRQ